MCYTCGSVDHLKRVCNRCQACGNIKKDPAHPREFEMRCCVCLRINHRVDLCRLLRRPAPGKYCHICKIAGSHTYSECRRRTYVKHHANLIADENDPYQDERFSDNWDNVPEYNWDKAKFENDSSDDDQTSSDDEQ